MRVDCKSAIFGFCGLFLVLACSSMAGAQTTVAEAGFNSDFYTNGDTLLDSPGTGESTWTSDWAPYQTPGVTEIQNSLINEGDQALSLTSTSASNGGRSVTYRDFASVTSGNMLLSFDMNITQTGGTGLFLVYLLEQDASAGGGDNGPTLRFEQDGTFNVYDGSTVTDSTLDYSPNTWHNVTVDANIVDQTYEVFLDGVSGGTYDFRSSNATSLGRLRLWNGYGTSSTAGIVTVDDIVISVPEPTSIALLGVCAVLGVMTYRRKC